MKKPAQPPPEIAAWVALARAHSRVLAEIEAALKAKGLVPLAWYDVLWELEQAGAEGLRPVELERLLLLPQYGLSRLLDRIAAAGLVERLPCPEDRRGRIVAIAEAGRAERRRAWPVYKSALNRALGEKLGSGDARQLVRLLGRLGGA